MKKFTIYLLVFVFVNSASFAQSRYLFVKFKDAQQPAVVNEFSFPEKTVSKAIDDKLERLGYKGKDSKGFTIYKGVTLSEFGSQPYDLYFQIDRKSKRDKENATVTMMLTKGDENFITEESDAATISKAKTFLDNLNASIEAYDLEQQITSQESDLKKAEKKYQNLLDDADNLQKAKKKLENNIENNLKDQKNQQAEVEKQQQIFDTLKGKRKS